MPTFPAPHSHATAPSSCMQYAGGIANEGGALTLSSSRIHHNTADNIGGYGGGIVNSGTNLDIKDSSIHHNAAGVSIACRTPRAAPCPDLCLASGAPTVSQGGGGIFNVATLIITGSSIQNNTAAADGGGGIYNAGPLLVASTSIDYNTATGGGRGGGILNDGTLNASNTTICFDVPDNCVDEDPKTGHTRACMPLLPPCPPPPLSLTPP